MPGGMADLHCMLDEFERIYFLPRRGGRENSFVKGYSVLSLASAEQGLLLFNVVPKMHWLWHMAWRARFLHPRLGSTCIDEDLVKHMMKKTWF